MKKIALVILIFIIGIGTLAQNDSTRGKQFELTGKISEKVQMPPACGVLAWATVIRFEITSLTGMNYTNRFIGIVVRCPELFGDNFFQKGRSYEIFFSDKNRTTTDYVIPNKDLLKKNNLAFEPYVLSIKRKG